MEPTLAVLASLDGMTGTAIAVTIAGSGAISSSLTAIMSMTATMAAAATRTAANLMALDIAVPTQRTSAIDRALLA
jgi:hypothetical protein